ncbi:uncharacterized protein PG998_004787 [Apiospora kogelbergensis]|uniref:uncharacterized protein n=1 Tax=Apiospora kogelbergensis TaxID=1337665 RepID=UPI00312F12CD
MSRQTTNNDGKILIAGGAQNNANCDVNMSGTQTYEVSMMRDRPDEVELEAATTSAKPERPMISIQQFHTKEGMLVKVTPPREPTQLKTAHVPCDIVLVLDVSSSMNAMATIIDEKGGPNMNTGYTVLDIVKQVARTIVQTLHENDRLGIVTFSQTAHVLQSLQPVAGADKDGIKNEIHRLKSQRGTNLWDGVKTGLTLFNANLNTDRVPALMVLTDGEPFDEPIKGYADALRAQGPLPASIYTLGFGDHIKSAVLSTIAEIGGGYYGFIPNSQVVCTVAAHAVAHIRSTFATTCHLELRVPHSATGLTMSTDQVLVTNQEQQLFAGTSWSFPLGNLHYGQSRDIYLRFNGTSGSKIHIEARLTQPYTKGFKHVEAFSVWAAPPSTLSEDEMSFHRNRNQICELILMLFPQDSQGSFIETSNRAKRINWFETFVQRLGVANHNDKGNNLLIEQIQGHIRDAVYAHDEKWKTWGRHYLMSVWFAHAKQLRTSFLDPGVEMYDDDSPLFLECQNRLFEAFRHQVPTPQPSQPDKADPSFSSGSRTLNMTSYDGTSLKGSRKAFQSTPSSSGKQFIHWEVLERNV